MGGEEEYMNNLFRAMQNQTDCITQQLFFMNMKNEFINSIIPLTSLGWLLFSIHLEQKSLSQFEFFSNLFLTATSGVGVIYSICKFPKRTFAFLGCMSMYGLRGKFKL